MNLIKYRLFPELEKVFESETTLFSIVDVLKKIHHYHWGSGSEDHSAFDCYCEGNSLIINQYQRYSAKMKCVVCENNCLDFYCFDPDVEGDYRFVKTMLINDLVISEKEIHKIIDVYEE